MTSTTLFHFTPRVTGARGADVIAANQLKHSLFLPANPAFSLSVNARNLSQRWMSCVCWHMVHVFRFSAADLSIATIFSGFTAVSRVDGADVVANTAQSAFRAVALDLGRLPDGDVQGQSTS